MGIRVRSLLVMGLLGLVAIVVIGVTSYQLSMKNAREEAKIKSNIILNYAMATKSYMKNVQKPLVKKLVDADRFYPELMSGFVSARGTFEIFNKNFPGYIFKQATLDPLNPYNRATQQETRMIEAFGTDSTLRSSEGRLLRNGEEFFYFAQPIKVDSRNCLTCHGDPADAPRDQVQVYGTENGYNWSLNDTVAAFVIYIPTAAAKAAASQLSVTLILISAAGILLVMLFLWFFLDRSVVLPIVHLAKRTESFSLGENLDEPIATRSKTEIGSLAKAVERLRISLVKLLKNS